MVWGEFTLGTKRCVVSLGMRAKLYCKIVNANAVLLICDATI